MVDLINQYPDEIDLIAIGPLSNLATAVKIDPSIPSKLRSLTIMGGNMNGIGNMHVVGEFNFYADPEGAKVVLDEYTPKVKIFIKVLKKFWKCPTRIITWEACCINQFDPDTFTSKIKTDLGTFLHTIKGAHVDGDADFTKMSSTFSNYGEVMCDLLAAVARDICFITKIISCRLVYSLVLA